MIPPILGEVQREGLLTSASNPLTAMQGVRTPDSAEPAAGPEDPFAELPVPVTSLEAKRVWDQQRSPSSRSVAKALTQAGRPVHFTTVARWKKREWQVEARLLRSGLVTTAVKRGVNLLKICDQTGHKSLEMLRVYCRDAELFVG